LQFAKQDCGSCETIFYSAFCHQMAAADSWRVYNLQYTKYNTEYRYTVYNIQVTGIRNTECVNALRRCVCTIIRTHYTSGTSTYEST
jgi:hypothetical protein